MESEKGMGPRGHSANSAALTLKTMGPTSSTPGAQVSGFRNPEYPGKKVPDEESPQDPDHQPGLTAHSGMLAWKLSPVTPHY